MLTDVFSRLTLAQLKINVGLTVEIRNQGRFYLAFNLLTEGSLLSTKFKQHFRQ